MSTTTPVQIRIDADTRKEANELFAELGTDMSGAVNMFLKQCIAYGGIPFRIQQPRYRRSTIKAMEEAKRVAQDPDAPTYKTMEEFRAAMES